MVGCGTNNVVYTPGVKIWGCDSVAYYGDIGDVSSRWSIDISNCVRFMMPNSIPNRAILNYKIFDMPNTLRMYQACIYNPIFTPDMIGKEVLSDGTVKNYLIYPKTHKLAGQRVRNINIPSSARVFMTFASSLISFGYDARVYDSNKPTDDRYTVLANLTIDINEIYIPPRTYAYFSNLVWVSDHRDITFKAYLNLKKVSIGAGFENYPYTSDGTYSPDKIGGYSSLQYLEAVRKNFIYAFENKTIREAWRSNKIKLIDYQTTVSYKDFTLEYRGENPYDGGFSCITEVYGLSYYIWEKYNKFRPEGKFMSPIIFPLKDSAYDWTGDPPSMYLIKPYMFNGQLVMSETSKW